MTTPQASYIDISFDANKRKCPNFQNPSSPQNSLTFNNSPPLSLKLDKIYNQSTNIQSEADPLPYSTNPTANHILTAKNSDIEFFEPNFWESDSPQEYDDSSSSLQYFFPIFLIHPIIAISMNQLFL
jgi:hypothetical protein